jgi:acetoin utilization deacetylase AcuC-like enzyme
LDVPVYFDPQARQHDPGHGQPETAARLTACVETLRAAGRRVESPPSPARTAQAIRRVHSVWYTERLRKACVAAPEGAAGRAFALFDSPDNPISSATYEASTRAVGLVLAGVDAVLAGAERAVFVAARPPGHHALAAKAMGFCFLNTIAVAARDLVEEKGLSRVLVADFDVHHGNGTQELLWEDGQNAYLSVHRFPFSPGTGGEDETGTGRGLGATVNVPMPAGAGDRTYAEGFRHACEKLADRFKPEFVLLSSGFDAHAHDPLGGMRVSEEGFATMTRIAREVADTFGSGRVVSLLEGGYDEQALGRAASTHVEELADSRSLPV